MKKSLFSHLIYALRIELEFSNSPEKNTYFVKGGKRVIQIGATPRSVILETVDVTEDVLHEIGHLLVAPPSRRNKPDYGIPDQYQARNRNEAYWDIDESKARLVARDLSYFLGRNKIRITFSRTILDPTSRWWNREGKHIVPKLLKDVDKLVRAERLPL